MANETIPLAKLLEVKKLTPTGYLSVKLDGVPVRIDIEVGEGLIRNYAVRTRQGEPVESVQPVVQELLQHINNDPFLCKERGAHSFVAEVTHRHLRDFKDVSGVVRRKSPQEDLVLNFFDYVDHARPTDAFSIRLRELCRMVEYRQPRSGLFRAVTQWGVTPETFEAHRANLYDRHPNCEGLIYRSADAVWAPGTRRWDYMKVLNEPTVDLKIIGFEEAISKTGDGLGMVGRLVADYRGQEIGIGPGKLTHEERREIFREFHKFRSGIASVKYKRDPSYDALRQPTFQHWRPEKTEPSYE